MVKKMLQDTDDCREPPQQVTTFEVSTELYFLFSKVEKTKNVQAIRVADVKVIIGEMKISPGHPRCGCQGHYCMPHPHT